jgi:hypothetical protein
MIVPMSRLRRIEYEGPIQSLMRTLAVIAGTLWLALPICCAAADPPASVLPQPLDGSPTNLSDATVEKALPKEYGDFKRALTGAFGTNDVSAAMRLVDQAGDVLLKAPQDSAEQRQAMDTYRGAWRLALRIYLGAKETAATNLFVSEWNRHLADRDTLAASQLYALTRVWDPRLLTSVFWDVIGNTDSRRMVMAIAWLTTWREDNDGCDKVINTSRKDRRLTTEERVILYTRALSRKSDLAHNPSLYMAAARPPPFDFY